MRQHYVRAADLREGDYLDLEGDKIADPKRDRIAFQSEFAMVASVERETPTCVAVGIEGVDVFGFPPDHMVKIGEELTASGHSFRTQLLRLIETAPDPVGYAWPGYEAQWRAARDLLAATCPTTHRDNGKGTCLDCHADIAK